MPSLVLAALPSMAWAPAPTASKCCAPQASLAGDVALPGHLATCLFLHSPTPRAYSKSYYTRAGRRQLCSCLIPDSNSVFRTKVAGPGYLQDAPPVPPMDSDILFRHRLNLLAAPVSNTLCSHVKIWGETALITGSFAKLCVFANFWGLECCYWADPSCYSKIHPPLK